MWTNYGLTLRNTYLWQNLEKTNFLNSNFYQGKGYS